MAPKRKAPPRLSVVLLEREATRQRRSAAYFRGRAGYLERVLANLHYELAQARGGPLHLEVERAGEFEHSRFCWCGFGFNGPGHKDGWKAVDGARYRWSRSAKQ
jgi:hypothetical protein